MTVMAIMEMMAVVTTAATMAAVTTVGIVVRAALAVPDHVDPLARERVAPQLAGRRILARGLGTVGHVAILAG